MFNPFRFLSEPIPADQPFGDTRFVVVVDWPFVVGERDSFAEIADDVLAAAILDMSLPAMLTDDLGTVPNRERLVCVIPAAGEFAFGDREIERIVTAVHAYEWPERAVADDQTPDFIRDIAPMKAWLTRLADEECARIRALNVARYAKTGRLYRICDRCGNEWLQGSSRTCLNCGHDISVLFPSIPPSAKAAVAPVSSSPAEPGNAGGDGREPRDDDALEGMRREIQRLTARVETLERGGERE